MKRTNGRPVTLFSSIRASRTLPLITAMALILPMFPRPAQADAAPAPSGQPGVYDAAVGIAESGAAVANGASAVTVDPATGVAHAAVPFQLPKARGRSQPRLGLSYSSAAGEGTGGWGWTLTVPSIERTPLAGPPTYADPPAGGALDPTKEDRFSLGGEPLVPVCKIPDTACHMGDNAAYYINSTTAYSETLPQWARSGWTYFRLETNGADGRVFWSPDHTTWVVQYKSGETLEFGRSLGNAQGDGEADAIDWDRDKPSYAFRWNLIRQYDAERDPSSGVPVNRIVYRWAKLPQNSLTQLGDPRLYLTDIYDTFPVSRANAYPDPQLSAHHTHLVYEQPQYERQHWPLSLTSLVPPIWRAAPQFVLSRVDVSAFWDVQPTPSNPNPPGYQTRRLVRRYWLSHGDDTYAKRSYLASVQIEGRCTQIGPDLEQSDFTVSATSGCPMLPSQTFKYTTTFPTFAPTPLIGSVNEGDIQYILDMNGDGIPDLMSQTTPPGSTVASLWANTVSENSKDMMGATSYVATSYPPGFTPAFPGLFTGWGGTFTPGNFLGDGHMNLLIVGSYVPAVVNFAAVTPQRSSLGWSLQGASSSALPFWTAGSYPTTKDSWYVDPERAPYMVDVDGDGYGDAITYTGIGQMAYCALCGPHYVIPDINTNFFLSLRTTVANADGTITPFGRAAPNAVSHSVPPGAPPNLIPANGQYVASVAVDMYTARLLGGQGNPTSHISDFFEDMNGDGLVDWVTLDTVSLDPHNLTLQYWIGHGDGTFGSCSAGDNNCTGSARFAGSSTGSSAMTPFGGVPDLVRTTGAIVHDVTGDGLPDLVLIPTTSTATGATIDGITIYVNRHGYTFDGGNVVGFPAGTDASQVKFFFGDMNGSGSDDLVIIQPNSVSYVDTQSGLATGLLQTISNGYGGLTTLEYTSTTDLRLKAAAASAPWQTTSPQVMHHVTKVTATNGMPAPLTETRTTEYSYQDPIYDGRDRTFAGFRTVTARADGDASEPTQTTQTTFLSGLCSVDLGSPCPANPVDRPFGALRGRPVLVDTFDDAGHHLSTVHTTYQVNEAIQGLDGRGVRFAYASTTDNFLYDSSSSVAAATSGQAVVDAQFSDSTPPLLRTVKLYAGPDSNSLPVHVVRKQTLDSRGNLTDSQDLGVAGKDATIHSTATWTLAAGADHGNWMWRPLTKHVDPSATAPGDQAHDITLSYYPDGQLQTATTTIHGTGQLVRGNPAGNYASAPTTASTEGATIQLASLKYDPFGNQTYATAPRNRCARQEYDAIFAQLPTTKLVFKDGCDSGALSTSRAWDRGFEQPTMSVGPANETTAYSYDEFGRVSQTFPPDPVTGVPVAAPSLYILYDPSDSTHAPKPGHRVLIQASDGSGYRTAWSYSDGWGQKVATVAQADRTAGDAGDWVVTGAVSRSARGAVVKAYTPFFWSGDPSAYPLSSGFSSSSSQTTYDAFGQVLTTFGIGGKTQTSLHRHIALSESIQDAEQIAGTHQGSLTGIVHDGHGRVSTTLKLVSDMGDLIATSTVYTATGKPAVISQSHMGDASTVQRTFVYDSLGHMVSNVEPNTSSNGIGWRYVYDDAGDLVGTSDARGCGENLSYDGLGRLQGEDYSPCQAGQAIYTSVTSNPDGSMQSTGTEAFYVYDTDGGGIPGYLDGRLAEVDDRAARTVFQYDERDRVTNVSRQLARPTAAAIPEIANRYSPWTFSTTTGYDFADRVVSQSTGADVAELLGSDGASNVTASYSGRGFLRSIQGSYGTLIAKNVVDVDGLPLQTQYGDVDATTAYECYDGLRRLSETALSRGVAPPACAHAPSPPPLTTQPAQTVLSDEQIVARDRVGNPLQVVDNRVASEWSPGNPAIDVTGALPVDRSYTYDGLYEVKTANSAYHSLSQDDVYVPPVPLVSNESPLALASGGNRVRSQTFAYDWLGNTTQTTDDRGVFFDRSLGSITNGSVAYGPNKLVSANLAGPTGGSLGTAYDHSGNLTVLSLNQSGTCTSACARFFQYDWDEVGQLSGATRWDQGATAPAAIVSYAYDASGTRVLRASTDLQSGQIHYNAEIFPSLRLNGATWDDTTATYTRTKGTEAAYLVLGGASYGRVALTQSRFHLKKWVQHVYFETSDTLSSTSAVFEKATGALVERTAYQPYGALESDYRPADTGPNSDNVSSFSEVYKFGGKEEDVDFGLSYFGARYYSANLGRWISPDPLAIHTARGDLNPYAYGHGRVTLAVDPTGLEPMIGAEDFTTTTVDPGTGDFTLTYPNTIEGFDQYIEFAPGNDADVITGHVHYSVEVGTPNYTADEGEDPIDKLPGPSREAVMNRLIAEGSAQKTQDFLSHVEPSPYELSVRMRQQFVISLVDAIPIAGTVMMTAEATNPNASDTSRTISGVGAVVSVVPFFGGAIGKLGSAAEAAPGAYSVAFEAKLTQQGIGTYASHFAEANEQLLKAMADPETANALRSTLGADFEGSIVSSSGGVRGVSPSGWTWHHAGEPGVLQLVPGFQHAPGSAWQGLLHPGGVGGMSTWGSLY